jgi:protease-4
MRTDRILALLLIIACFVAAIAAWIRPAVTPSARLAPLSTGGQADVALIDVYGTISDGQDLDGFFGSTGATANRLVKAIREAERDHVKAILVRINSPGGTAAASQMVYSELMRVRKAGHIKVVAAMGDVAASGGYYIASAAQHIVANPATTTGSIGVIIHVGNIARLFDKLGISETTIQSGVHKDILSPFRPIKSDERTLLQGLVNDTYEQFLAAVEAGRHLSDAQLRPIADGRVFDGKQALAVHLVDSLGTYQEAIAKAASLAGVKGEPSVRTYPGGGLFEQVWPRFESRLPAWLGGASAERWNKVPLALME